MNTGDLIGLSSGVGLGLVLVFTVWYFFVRKYIKVYVMREYGDAFKIIKTAKIGFSKTGFTHKGHQYAIDLTQSVFNKRNLPELFFKQNETEPVTFKGSRNPKNSEITKTILKANVFKNIFGQQLDQMYLIILVALALGLVAVSIYSTFRISQLQTEIAKLIVGGAG